ncbi:hypothetical protein M011DRAFT_459151 [Sporormia fimetaria CBS 119925]|uniref:Uncharacterized protein n=1 Tax=Sporormia fimetaria CBS 119925 TaxID=1340428 RepID=A0A6A6V827_9PLEO|nr:hypothetical protein M011DRAFT_459151 [Sporormia fimetaria CBS 119925]
MADYATSPTHSPPDLAKIPAKPHDNADSVTRHSAFSTSTTNTSGTAVHHKNVQAVPTPETVKHDSKGASDSIRRNGDDTDRHHAQARKMVQFNVSETDRILTASFGPKTLQPTKDLKKGYNGGQYVTKLSVDSRDNGTLGGSEQSKGGLRLGQWLWKRIGRS